MHSVRRSCQSALRNLDNLSLYTNVSRRAFSRTCTRHRGALPVYLEPSSPELSNLLSTLNSKILLPNQLNKDQEKLVYRKENIPKLDNEPIEITLGDVTLPLEHINRVRDIPARWKQLREIVRHSETSEDWENVVRVMEGFENAGIHLKPAWREMIVRKLNENEMQHLVLKALQRAQLSGLRLRDYGLLRQVVKGVHDKAAYADWDKDETRKALSFAEQIVELMEKPEHCGKAAPEHDFRTKPMVIALPAEMAVTFAKKHGGDVEKAKKYTKRLMDSLKQNEFLAADLAEIVKLSTELNSKDLKNGSKQMAALTDFSYKIWALFPIWNALNTARSLLGVNMPMAQEAAKIEKKIGDVLEKSTETTEKLRFRDGKEMASKDSIAGYVAEGVRREL